MDHLRLRKFTTNPSPYDSKDYVYKESKEQWRVFVDLREWDTSVENQSQLGSCVGNAIANAYEHMVKRKYSDNLVDLSRLFIYYNARLKSNKELKDEGTTVKAGLQAIKTYGVCEEILWPYDINKFDDTPSEEAYKNAEQRKIISYTRLFHNKNVIDALATNKPVVFGIDVYDSFMLLDKNNYVVSDPLPNDILVGGHAMCLVGYDLKKNQFLAKNSFGTEWGDKGYCWIPFGYFSKRSYDKWIFEIPNQNILLS